MLLALFWKSRARKEVVHMLLDERAAAEYLGCSVGMMRKWRLFGEGPAYCKLGRLVRYSQADLNTFIEENRVANPQAGNL